MIEFMEIAIQEAKLGGGEGGIPIGAVLVKDVRVIGRGQNKRVQDDNAVNWERRQTAPRRANTARDPRASEALASTIRHAGRLKG